MSTFLKLSQRIINIRQISEITYTKPGIYNIYFSHSTGSGFSFFGTGWFDNSTDRIEINEKENKSDFDIVSEWINKPK